MSNSQEPVIEKSQEDEKREAINIILEMLPKKKLLQEFSRHFLGTMSIRTLLNITHDKLPQLLIDRFNFFLNVLNGKKEGFLISKPKDAPYWLKDRLILELVYPDARHLVMTLDTLFHKYNLRLTRKLHPIIGITRDDKGNLKDIIQSSEDIKENVELISFVYVAFEEIPDQETLNSLKKDIQYHMSAVQFANQEQENITERLLNAKYMIKEYPVNVDEPKQEWINLIDWLRNLNFSFFGYISYKKKGGELKLEKNSGLGILNPKFSKDYPAVINALTDHIKSKHTQQQDLMFDSILANSPLQRFDNLMRLAIQIKLPNGSYHILNFVGILKRSSLLAKNIETPLIHLKMDYVFKSKHMIPGSFNYNEVIRMFTATPKFELFRTPKDILLEMVENILSITNPNNIQCFKTHFPEESRILYLIALPSLLYSQDAIDTITHYLNNKIDYKRTEIIRVTEDEKYRLHIYYDLSDATQHLPSPTNVEADISELLKPWKDKFRGHMFQRTDISATDGLNLINKFYDLIPSHYIARTHPKDAAYDLITINNLCPENPISFRIIPFEYPLDSDLAGKASLISIYSYEKLDLISILPVLQNLGIHVIDQLTSRIADSKKTYGFIQSFRVMNQDMEEIDEDEYGSLLNDLLLKVFKNEIENDPLNGLSLSASLDWRSINLIQTYRNYYLQLLPPYSKDKINNTLLKYPETTKLLFHYFEAKFSTDSNLGTASERDKNHLNTIKKTFLDSLDQVQEISEDTIIRRLFNAIESTLRTNFYIEDKHRPKELDGMYDPKAISIKINSQKIDKMPAPRPYREIYVHGSGVEAVHIRFGPVARGGLRWSNREDDFRTEILGLVKTQQTKNVVIVPVGSKGGFIVKRPPVDKQKLQTLTQYQYRTFIHSMLEITDNINAAGKVIKNKHIVAYDDVDPYLVVAADKGTATFSDLANQISTARKFWLDDGFASGGSYGYDHKKVGITAKGAWECTKLHFKEKGTTIDKDIISVAGIGDMAGDVFGNGMLLSRHIKLVAAFNHMHIFLDPNPDPETSYQERERLFKLPRSTWEDYNPKLLSKGGAIFSRSSKEIKLTPEIKKLLGVKQNTLSAHDLILAILKMKVDLLWFGGIGTYIKASSESHIQVGDAANNNVRIDATECRASVIGEGANLGITQLARIEFSKLGGRINTDAIDNSAGVNMSDYEVNLKILLKSLVDKKVITQKKQRQLLEKATDEVTELVLENNREQHKLMSLDLIRSKRNFGLFSQLILELIDKDILDGKTWFIPSQTELSAMEKDEIPLHRSITSILQAHVKMVVYDTLRTSELVKDAFFYPLYKSYFPKTILKVFESKINDHPLKYDIISMLVTNYVVNQVGSTFFYQLQHATGKSIEDIVKTYLIADQLLSGEQFRSALSKETIAQEDIYKAQILFEDILLFICKDLLQLTHKSSIQFSDITKYKVLVTQLKDQALSQEKFPTIQWQKIGFSKAFSKELAILPQLEILPEAIYLHEVESLPTDLASQLLFQVEDVFGFNWLENTIRSLAPESYWEIEQQNQLLEMLYTIKLSLINLVIRAKTHAVLRKTHVRELLSTLDDQYSIPLKHYFTNYSELKHSPTKCDLTTLSVCLNRLVFLQ